MLSVECGVWSVECGVWSVECGVLSVECWVWMRGEGRGVGVDPVDRNAIRVHAEQHLAFSIWESGFRVQGPGSRV